MRTPHLPRQKSDQKELLANLFECNCPFLRRPLPFRTTFLRAVTNDLRRFFPPTQKHLTIVFDQPGGLFWEWQLITRLQKKGYAALQIILIEPLTHNQQIKKAHTAFAQLVTPARCLNFESWESYATACAKNPSLKGNSVISSDPDPEERFIDFSTKKARQKWLKRSQQTLEPFSYHATLFFQEIAQRPYRHSMRLTLNQRKKVPLTCLIHHWGATRFDHQETHVFWGTQKVLATKQLLLIAHQPLVAKKGERQQFQQLVRFLQQQHRLQLPKA